VIIRDNREITLVITPAIITVIIRDNREITLVITPAIIRGIIATKTPEIAPVDSKYAVISQLVISVPE
jgi:hypothetical protein